MKELAIPKYFVVGQYYTNDQICYALEVGNSGGIRPKLNQHGELDFVALFTSSEENKHSERNPYADRIEGDVLTYTGAGLKGEQTISGVNKRLFEQVEKPIPILGFVKEETNRYRYLGLLFLLRHFEDFQLDHESLMRKVLIFEFQIISQPLVLEIGKFDAVFSEIYFDLKKKIIEGDTVVLDVIDEVRVKNEVDELKKIEELKSKLMLVDPYEFEELVGELVKYAGFSSVRVTKKSGDEGVDVNAILENPIATRLQFLFQVKRWKHSVGRNEVANLRGSMGINNQGVIISTSHFTASAMNEANLGDRVPIHLVGIEELYRVIHLTGFDIDKSLSELRDGRAI